MDENDWLAERFEDHRARLQVVAYRMLGSLTEADDAVQDAWLRLSRSGAEEVENLGGWLTTVVARVCLNMLRSRSTRREDSFGVHLPDPVISPDRTLQPEDEALLADSATGHQALTGIQMIFARPEVRWVPTVVNGAAGAIITFGGEPVTVMGFTVAGGRIAEIASIADPDRVRRITA